MNKTALFTVCLLTLSLTYFHFHHSSQALRNTEQEDATATDSQLQKPSENPPIPKVPMTAQMMQKSVKKSAGAQSISGIQPGSLDQSASPSAEAIPSKMRSLYSPPSPEQSKSILEKMKAARREFLKNELGLADEQVQTIEQYSDDYRSKFLEVLQQPVANPMDRMKAMQAIETEEGQVMDQILGPDRAAQLRDFVKQQTKATLAQTNGHRPATNYQVQNGGTHL